MARHSYATVAAARHMDKADRPLPTMAAMTSASRATPLLEARALSFHRQDEPVFGPLDFRLEEGELTLIEGDNGSGKTTLMRILTGLLHPEEGELFWRGEPLSWSRCAGDVVFLGHQLGLKTELSPRENLAFSIGMHGQRDGIDIDGALSKVGLQGLCGRAGAQTFRRAKKTRRTGALVTGPRHSVAAG